MSALETSVQDLLPAMIKGENVVLDASARGALAAWSLKTILMSAAAYSSQAIVPPGDFTDFYEQRRPTRHMVARLGMAAPPEHGPVALMAEFLCPAFAMPGGHAYIATLRVGYLVMQVLRVGPLDEGRVLVPFPANTSTVPLWPVPEDAGSWPPPQPIPMQDWEGFTHPDNLEAASMPTAGQ
ncbi:hypothetical protein ACFXPX_04550 [Kitasatospora sp. NPDC059146]|uniref:hypothetical protein n=1 Tax=unclassified Kitasatospora TaxID=2633591 RepID=UPI00369FD4F2